MRWLVFFFFTKKRNQKKKKAPTTSAVAGEWEREPASMRPSCSSPLRIRQLGCNHLHLLHPHPPAWGVHAAPREPPGPPGAGRASPAAGGGGDCWGCAMLSGMGEWRGTLNFLASARSWRSGCRGSIEPSPAACSCLPPASSPARSVLPLPRSASLGAAGCSSGWAGASDGYSERCGLLFFSCLLG